MGGRGGERGEGHLARRLDTSVATRVLARMYKRVHPYANDDATEPRFSLIVRNKLAATTEGREEKEGWVG